MGFLVVHNYPDLGEILYAALNHGPIPFTFEEKPNDAEYDGCDHLVFRPHYITSPNSETLHITGSHSATKELRTMKVYLKEGSLDRVLVGF